MRLQTNIEAARAATSTYANQVAEGRNVQDAWGTGREMAGITMERDGIAKGPEAARRTQPSKESVALADEINRSRSSLGFDYNKETDQMIDTHLERPFDTPRRDKGKGPAQPMREPVARPENYRPPRVPQEIAAERPDPGPSETRQITKAELRARNFFNGDFIRSRQAAAAEFKHLSGVKAQEFVAERQRGIAEREAHSKAADTQAAKALSRQEELAVKLEEARKAVDAAVTRQTRDATNAHFTNLKAEYDLEVAKEQAAVQQTRQDLEEVISLKNEISLAEDIRAMEIEVAKMPGGFDWEGDMAEEQREEIMKDLEPANAAADDVLWTIEARDGFETSVEQRQVDRMVRERRFQQELPHELEPGGGSQGSGSRPPGGPVQELPHPDPPTHPDPPVQPDPPVVDPPIPAPPVADPPMPAPPVADPPTPAPPVADPPAPAPAPAPAPPAPEGSIDYIPPVGSRRPGYLPAGSAPNNAPSIAEQAAEEARQRRSRNPQTETQQATLDAAFESQHEVYQETWERQSRNPEFWRTWDDTFKFDKAADYWKAKGEIDIHFRRRYF